MLSCFVFEIDVFHDKRGILVISVIALLITSKEIVWS